MAEFSTVVLINGEETREHTILDRAFAFGDGVFETLLICNGKVPLWPEHCQRLQRGCDRLKIPLDIRRLNRYVSQGLARLQSLHVTEAILKVTVSRGVSARGYGVSGPIEPTLVLALFPAPPALSPVNAGIRLKLCRHRLSVNPVLAGIKHLNRLDNVLAKLECQQAGFDDGLVLDQDGWVVEAVSSNVFFRQGLCWVTPRIFQAGVLGVARQVILDNLLTGVKVVDVHPDEILGADEVFICNSITGVAPVVAIDKTSFAVGEQTLELRAALHNYIMDKAGQCAES